MKSNEVKYESCDYYARRGNAVFRNFFDNTYPNTPKEYVEPDDCHSLYDIQMNMTSPTTGKNVTYYCEVKFKFNKVFYDDFTFITQKKVNEINEFMKDKDKEHEKFLYFIYYPMIGKSVMFDLTHEREYAIRIERNWSATANLTDIQPTIIDVKMCLLPMCDRGFCKIRDFSSSVAVKFNNKTYLYGKEINQKKMDLRLDCENNICIM